MLRKQNVRRTSLQSKVGANGIRPQKWHSPSKVAFALKSIDW
ncbi:MAG: hypothetical protein SWX82_05595 [Cyanobacteriota bacterium]|nr:hypothetical protein [Cyanobacteriota bacterium]